jgi:hypothetical protein
VFPAPAEDIAASKSDQPLWVKVGGRYGIAKVDGTWTVEPTLEFLNVRYFSEGLAAAKTSDGWGYVDLAGHWVITPGFDVATVFRDGAAEVLPSGAQDSLFIDRGGAPLNDVRFAQSLGYSEGLAPVQLRDSDGSWIYIDKAGRKAIDGDFSFATNFWQGLASVETEGLKGVIDTQGHWVLPPGGARKWVLVWPPVIMVENEPAADVPPYSYFDATGRPIIPHS